MISALSRMNNLQQRIIVGVIGSFIVIFLIHFSEWAYFALFMFISAFSLYEFYRLLGMDGMFPLKIFGTLMGLLLFTLTFMVQKGLISSDFYYVLFPLFSLSFIIKLYKKEIYPFVNVALTYLGVLYVMVPFALMTVVVFKDGTYNHEIMAGCLFILWASDTGAYFAGKYLGRHKLFKRVSPKKTWEGTFGGLFLALFFSYLMSIVYTSIPFYEWILTAVVIVIFGSFGDLIESLFKRSMAIKDSGSTLPGHGGFLDRFDGLLLAAPFILIIYKIL